MSKEEKNQDLVVKGPKGEFDLSDPSQKAQLEGYIRGLVEQQGRLAHENDKVKKRYELVTSTNDIRDAKARVAKMREEGMSEDDIDNFWTEFVAQTTQQAKKGDSFGEFWAEYKASRKSQFDKMSKFEQDLWKDQVQDKYIESLQQAPDQFRYLDELFEFNARSQSEPDEPAPYVEGGSSSPRPQKAQEPEGGDDPYAESLQQKRKAFADPWS